MRFVFRDHGTRAVKAQVVRDIMAGFDTVGPIVAVPAIELTGTPGASRPHRHGRTDSERGDVHI